MTKAARKTRRTSPRRTRRRSESIYYVVCLDTEDWDWSLSFGVSRIRADEGPYADYRHLVLKGGLLRPRKVKAAAVEVIFLPSSHLNEDSRQGSEPLSIGSISLRRGAMQMLLDMPADALPSTLPMVIAGKFRFVVVEGGLLYRGQAKALRFSLDMSFDEEGLPGDE